MASIKGNDYSYYASKSELLTWVNTLLQLQLTRLEQFSNGAVYCQLIDAFHEDVVPIHKVNFFAKEEHEAVPNYKALQTAFGQLQIVKELNVQRMAKGAKADTLELLQFLHKMLTKNEPLPIYNGRERRAMSSKGGTDNIPLPAHMSASFDTYGRGSGFRTSSGSWGCAIDSQQSLRQQMRASGIHVPTYTPRSPKAPDSPSYNRRPQQPHRQSTIASKFRSGAQKMRESFTGSEADSEYSEAPSFMRSPSISSVHNRVTSPVATSASTTVLTPSELPPMPVLKKHTAQDQATATDPLPVASPAEPVQPSPPEQQQQDPPAAAITEQKPAALASPPTSSSSTPLASPTRDAGLKPSNFSALGTASCRTRYASTITPQGQNMGEGADSNEPGDRTGAGVTIVEVNEEPEAQEQPGMQMMRQVDEQGATRLIISKHTLSDMARIQGASPAALQALAQGLAAAKEALAQLSKAAAHVTQISEHLGCGTDTLAYRGKVRSFLDAVTTVSRYSEQLLQELLNQQRSADCGDSSAAFSANAVLTELRKVMQQHSAAAEQLTDSLAKVEAPATGNMPLTQLQKQVTSTSGLEGALRQVGMALAALMHLQHRASAAAGESYLNEPVDGESGPPRVLKLGEFHMKRLKNGDVYKGKYQHGRKNGSGVYHFTNGDVYQGEFSNDRMEGIGVYAFGPEGLYEGGWKSAVYSGCGAEHFTKGSTYKGQYGHGVRHGYGACRFLNGDYYEGQWSKGLREGAGMQQCTDDSNYVGEYSGGKRHGHGVYSFPNGDQYLGEYCDDIPHGYGVYLFSSGQRYEGHWAKGKKHGWSIYTVETGQRWAGSWGEGKPQWVHPVLPDGSPEGVAMADLPQEAQLNLNTSLAAHKNAIAASKVALERAAAHWALEGEMQAGLAAALEGSREAVRGSEECRARMLEHIARLDAAAVLIYQGSRQEEQIMVASS